jgi:hypothetical protein
MVRPPLSDSQGRMIGGLSKQATLPVFSQGSVSFNGVDSYFILSDRLTDSVTTNLTLIVAFKPRRRARGWVISNNNLFSGPPKGPVGFGIHMDETGLLRPLVGSENRFAANKLVSAGQTQVVSLVASPSLYKMWVNSTIAFDKQNVTGGQARSVGPRSATQDPFTASEEILRSAKPLTLAVGGTAGQQDEFLDGTISEVLVYPEVLSEEDRLQAERALCLRWQGCTPNAGQVSFKVLQQSVKSTRQYYNVELKREGGSDGVLQVTYAMDKGSAVPGQDFQNSVGIVTWEHGDSLPKYISVHILDKLAIPKPSVTVGISLSLHCATYPQAVSITSQIFTLSISPVPTPFWTGFQSSPAQVLGLSLGGSTFSLQAAGISTNASEYGCEFAAPIPVEQCVCDSDGSCKFTRQIHCPLAEAACSHIRPAISVNVQTGVVTCPTPQWTCSGNVAAVHLLRRGTANDVVCRQAAGVNSSISVNFVAYSVFYEFLEECFVPEWVRVPLKIDTGVSEDLKLSSFTEPVISSITPRQGPTAGGGRVTLHGNGFSSTPILPVVRVGQTDCISSQWVSSTSVVCTNMSAGVGPNLNVSLLTRGGAVRAVSGMAFSYELPMVTAVTPKRINRTGNVLITVQGRNFGLLPPAGGASSVAVNMSKGRTVVEPLMTGGCMQATWISDSAITCMASPGIGAASVSIVKISDDLVGTTNHALNQEPFEYEPARLTAVRVASVLFPRGGNIITLYGSEFGNYRGEKSLFLKTGNTDSDTVRWTSDSTVQAVTPAGAGRNVRVHVRINGQITDSDQNVTYPAITVTSISPLVGPARGGNSITVLGTNFGPTLETNLGQAIKIGANACPNLVYVSEGELVCEAPAGTGTALDVNLNINGYTAGLKAAFSYDAPRTFSVTPSTHASKISQVTTLTISGENFGAKDSTPLAFIGSTQCGVTKWVSDDAVLCIGGRSGAVVAPMQGFGSVPVVVSVAGQETDEEKAAKFVYTLPALSEIIPPDAPAAGGATVTVLGSSFGEASYSSQVTVELGGTPCATTTWVSDTRIDCVTPQATFTPPELFTQTDGFVEAVVNVAGARSPSQGLNFRFLPLPIIHSVNPANAPTTGGHVITLEGQGFGMQLDDLVVRVNSVVCVQTLWISRNRVTCKTPPGVGKSRAVSVQVSTPHSTMQNSRAGAFKYDEPEVHAFIHNGASIYNVPTLGNIQVTVQGKNFGITNQQMQTRVLVGETPCIQTSWVSDSRLICRTPIGHGASRKVQVNIACGQNHPPNAPLLSCTTSNQTYNVTYDAPILTRALISPSNFTAASAGNETLQLIGKNFGAFDPRWTIKIGPTLMSSVTWTSDSSISCMTPGGIGTNDISMSFAGVEPVFSRAFTYSIPQVLSSKPSSGLSIGGNTITINGKNFASTKHNVTVRIGSTDCQSSNWVSDTAITCVTSPGAYIDLSVTVKIDQSYEPVSVSGSGMRIFSYSSGSCEEILKYEPNSPSAEYLINPTALGEFSDSAFAMYCRMGRAQAAPGGLGTLQKDPIMWLDAADDSYISYKMYSDNQTLLTQESSTEVYVPGRGWGSGYSPQGKYRSPVAMWRSRIGNYSFTQELPGRRPMFVANDETLTFRMGQPPGAPYGLDYVHPGVMRFDGYDDFLVSNVPRSATGALSILIVAGKTLSSQGGWAMSDISINTAQRRVDGAGILFEPDGFVRPVGSMETRYSSTARVNVSLHVLTFRASGDLYTLHVDSSLAGGVDKHACTGGSSGANNGSECSGPSDSMSCAVEVTDADVPSESNLKLWLDASTIGPSDRAEMLPDGSLNPSIVTWNSIPSSTLTGLSSISADAAGKSNPQYLQAAVNRIWPAVRVGKKMFGALSADFSSTNGVTLVAVVRHLNGSAPSSDLFIFAGATGGLTSAGCLADATVRVNGTAVAGGYASAGSWGSFSLVSIVVPDSSTCDTLKFLGQNAASAPASETWFGDIAELMLWDTSLADADLFRAEDYLRSKYGVGPALCRRTGMPRIDPAAGQNLYLGTYPDALKRIISKTGNSGFFGGDIAEIILFDHVIPDSQRAAMERALCLRWLRGCAAVRTILTLSGLSSETFNSDTSALIIATIARILRLPVSQVNIESVADQQAAATRRRAMLRRLLTADPNFEGYADSLSVNLFVVITGLSEIEADQVIQSVLTMVSNSTLLNALKATGQFVNSELAFAPGGEPYTDGLVLTGNLSFAQHQVTVGESTRKVTVTVNRVDGKDGVIIAEWRTLNGTAMAGRDFVGASGRIMWNHSDDSSKTISVEILDDDTRDSDMQFMIEITPFYSEFMGQFSVTGPNTSTVTIKDNTLPDAPFWTGIVGTEAFGGTTDPARLYSGPVGGGFKITIQGQNFVPGDSDYNCVWYQPLEADGLYDPSCLECSREDLSSAPVVVSSTSLVCTVPQWDIISDSPAYLRLSKDGQGIDREGGRIPFIFVGPSPSRISSQTGTVVVPASGVGSFLIEGVSFGFASSPVSVYVGSKKATTASWVSDILLDISNFGIAGTGTNLDIRVSILGRNATLSGALSYLPPTVTAIIPNSGAGMFGSNSTVTVQGSNFGPGEATPTVKIGSSSCGNVRVVSDSQLTCAATVQSAATRDNAGTSVPVSVAVGGQQSAGASVTWTYRNLPSVMSIVPSSGDVVSATDRVVTVNGANFGTVDGKPKASLGDTQCTSTQWVSQSQVKCTSTGLTGWDALGVRVSVEPYGASSSSALYGFKSPVLTAVTGTVSAGGSITVTGSNFGVDDKALNCVIGDVSTVAQWTSDSSIICPSPARTGPQRAPIQVGVSTHQSLVKPDFVSGSAACLTSFTSAIPTAVAKLGDTITVLGKNFGSVGQPVNPSAQGRIRLVGPTATCGRVEIQHTNIYGTVRGLLMHYCVR